MNATTLLLNANATPISFLPISSISWQEAVKFIYTSAAEPVHIYDNWHVHSPSTTMAVPSVIILKDQIRTVRSWIARDTGGPQKHLVFLRDMYICQYCNEQFARRDLTIDHVLPRFHGGRTTWTNVTTCCSSCNCRRGHDVRIQPKVKPYRPTYSDLIKNMRKFPVTLPDMTWNYYIGWDETLVRIVNPRGPEMLNDNVDFGLGLNLNYTQFIKEA
jgi:5-methylcytosine-specific restriction endonuclease McrA